MSCPDSSNSCSSACSSSSSACSSSSSACPHCHVSNLSVDNGLAVGCSSTLNANSASGGALTVCNNTTQTSGTLVNIQGVADQTALTVTGNVELSGASTQVQAGGTLSIDVPNAEEINIGASSDTTQDASTINIGTAVSTTGGRLISLGHESAALAQVRAQMVTVGGDDNSDTARVTVRDDVTAVTLGAPDHSGAVVLHSPFVFNLQPTESSDQIVDYTAQQMLQGLFVRNYTGGGGGGGMTDTVASDVDIVNAIPDVTVGSAFQFYVQNVSPTDTVTVSHSGTTTVVAVNTTQVFLVRVTNATSGAEAVTISALYT